MRVHGQGHRGADVLLVKARPRVGLDLIAAAAAGRLVVGFDLYVK